MDLNNQSHHAPPRRTHSFDSYDSLDRLEERRQRRKEFFANRAIFEPRLPAPAVPPPEGSQSTDLPTRPLSPTSKLIQGYTNRLKEISIASDTTDSKKVPTPPERTSSTGKIKVISLESPKKVTYKTTCHVFPTFKVPSGEGEQESEIIPDKHTPGLTDAKPFTAPRYKPRLERSFSYLDEQIISRENSLTESTEQYTFEGSSTNRTNFPQLRTTPFQPPFYDDPTDEPVVMRRTTHQDEFRRPVVEPVMRKKLITEDGHKNYATPFQDVNHSPVSSQNVPKSYPAYLRQQSGKEWKPINASFDRSSAQYSSLPHRKIQNHSPRLPDEPDTKQLLQKTPDSTFNRSSSVYSSMPQRRTQSLLNKPDAAEISQNPRRTSTGSASELKLRSKTPGVPVRDLIEKFSNK